MWESSVHLWSISQLLSKCIQLNLCSSTTKNSHETQLTRSQCVRCPWFWNFFFLMKNVGLKFININALIRRKTNITFRLSNQIKQKKRLFLSSTDLLCLRSKAWLFLELVQHHYPSILSVLQLFHFEPHCEIPATEVSVCCVAPFHWWFQVIYGANWHLGGLEICMFSSDLHLAFQTHFSTQVEQFFILLGCALKSLQCNHDSTIWST